MFFSLFEKGKKVMDVAPREVYFIPCEKLGHGWCRWKMMLVVFVIVAAIIYFYSNWIRSKGMKDPLNYQFIRGGPNTRLDGWRITHFVFYTILGYFFPNCWKFALLISVSWEIIEMGMSSVRDDWQGNVTDIFVNMAGFFLGREIRVHYNTADCTCSC